MTRLAKDIAGWFLLIAVGMIIIYFLTGCSTTPDYTPPKQIPAAQSLCDAAGRPQDCK